VDLRVDQMIREGLPDEVRGLLDAGLSPDAQSMQGLGYKEMLPVLRGEMALADAAALGAELKDKFAKGEIDGLYVIFTKYHTMLSQEPTTKKLLPLDECEKPTRYTLFEPSSGAVLSAVIPEYISGMTYGAVCESFASELSARRTAMDSASKNAAEMIDALGLRYNRARQSAITQEITEIIGGSATS
ncbi:MAG: F0F1 ATP synthase subunit gamma, partial [Clostridia bacterium]|nr:F0F1 ATP synthase subunit gamma [Clostridia bacterium]